MADVVLGIDVGTSGVRVAAVDGSNTLTAISMVPITAPLQIGVRIFQDPDLWWAALTKAMEGVDLAGKTVKAIAVDGTSGTILSVAPDGTPMGKASMYNDVADAADIARVSAVSPKETAALGITSPLARALNLMVAGGRIVHQADWLAGQFSGRFDLTDESNALKSGYDPIGRRWPEWIAKAGFDVALFPQVVPSGSRIGTIRAEIADRFGLPRDVAVVAGTTDGCAAFLASGASDPGDGVTSLGTTLTLKLLSTRPVFAAEYGIYSHRIGDQWLAGGASNTGGVVIDQFFSKDDVMRLTPRLDPDNATGLDYYPLSKRGERFPINDPTLEPRMTPRPEDDHVFFQAILEGIAAVEALGYRRLAELGASPLISIRSTGGGAANTAWTKIRLRALAVPEKSSFSEHAAVGTARLAWRGIGHAN
jgi:sugar (pentulose or hexulose) kinase